MFCETYRASKYVSLQWILLFFFVFFFLTFSQSRKIIKKNEIDIFKLYPFKMQVGMQI